jgi:hypothetical protein
LGDIFLKYMVDLLTLSMSSDLSDYWLVHETFFLVSYTRHCVQVSCFEVQITENFLAYFYPHLGRNEPRVRWVLKYMSIRQPSPSVHTSCSIGCCMNLNMVYSSIYQLPNISYQFKLLVLLVGA